MGKKGVEAFLELEGVGQVLIKIIPERRKSYRAAIGKDALYLRYPATFGRLHKQQAWTWFQKWVQQTLRDKPEAFAHLRLRKYKSGQPLRVGSKDYVLSLEKEERKTGAAKLRNNTIYLQLPTGLTDYHTNKMIKTLLSRVIAQDFQPLIESRVHELNQLHFKTKHEIQTVRLKYNWASWGSCSNSNNINLSTRLLFAIPAAIDYVIIHELAHLEEFNHSPRFWRLVSDAMPDYKQQEEWLKEHFYACDF